LTNGEPPPPPPPNNYAPQICSGNSVSFQTNAPATHSIMNDAPYRAHYHRGCEKERGAAAPTGTLQPVDFPSPPPFVASFGRANAHKLNHYEQPSREATQCMTKGG
jgi:hypothetical protein